MKLHRLNKYNLMFECPGCGYAHRVRIGGEKQPIWEWNNDMEQPTFSPSIVVVGEYRCHCYVQNGNIKFLKDCTHQLAGQTVIMVEWDEEIADKPK